MLVRAKASQRQWVGLYGFRRVKPGEEFQISDEPMNDEQKQKEIDNNEKRRHPYKLTEAQMKKKLSMPREFSSDWMETVEDHPVPTGRRVGAVKRAEAPKKVEPKVETEPKEL